MSKPTNLQGDGRLTNLAIEHGNLLDSQFVARELFPLLDVAQLSGEYVIFDKTDYDLENDDIAPGGDVNQIDWGASTASYKVLLRALLHFLPDEARDNAESPIDAPARSTRVLLRKLLMRREVEVAAVAFAAAKYASGNKDTLTGDNRWSQSGSAPIAAILTAIDACSAPPDTLVLGPQTYLHLRSHADIVGAVKPATKSAIGKGIASAEEIAQLFNLDRVIVPRVKRNTAAKNKARVLSNVWGAHAALLKTKRMDDGDPIFAGLLAWNGAPASENGVNVQRGRDEKAGAFGGEWVKVAMANTPHVVDNEAGYFFENAGDASE